MNLCFNYCVREMLSAYWNSICRK